MGTRDRLLAPLRRIASPGPVAQGPTARALTAVFRAEALSPALFAPELLARVPLARLQETVDALRDRHGPLRSVRPQQELHRLGFARGAELVWAGTDAAGRLTTLVTGPGALLARGSAPAAAVPGPGRPGDDDPAALDDALGYDYDIRTPPLGIRLPHPALTPPWKPAPPPAGRATPAAPPVPPPAAPPAPAAAALQRTVLGYAAATAVELTIPFLTDTASGWALLLAQTPAFAWYVLRTAPAHTLPPWFRLLPLLPLAAAVLAAARALPLLGPGLPWTAPGLPETALAAAVPALAVWTHRRSAPIRPSPSAHPLVLASPLRGGRFTLTEGGGPAVNRYAQESLLPGGGRSHRYAVELVRLGAGPQWRGRRALGLAPAVNERYAVYGHPVVSPCDGVVVAAVDGLPDHEPYRSGADHPEGNHVAIDTGRALVVLSWLRQDSVRVRRGQHLTTGTPVAAVGNSGDGSEPALQLRAETRASRPLPGSGAGLPFRLAELRGAPLRGRRFAVPDRSPTGPGPGPA
ncbi:M23 family metallopeptidase [Streptacidiphilus sp. PB12-B1b]|uniref:M23 family metallopeptidase n=1 Tax=Streptacidiphilus sp. PB12-B1b TaxID=2705012 RepID=UPI0015FABD33|nr:M23 family metallopeptidase [Streptacidiphilus sp. PB12-B1b]QMU79528.1 M23 family metallopeptidase [Streptacidiphilus sp. PB12-B1b]